MTVSHQQVLKLSTEAGEWAGILRKQVFAAGFKDADILALPMPKMNMTRNNGVVSLSTEIGFIWGTKKDIVFDETLNIAVAFTSGKEQDFTVDDLLQIQGTVNVSDFTADLPSDTEGVEAALANWIAINAATQKSLNMVKGVIMENVPPVWHAEGGDPEEGKFMKYGDYIHLHLGDRQFIMENGNEINEVSVDTDPDAPAKRIGKSSFFEVLALIQQKLNDNWRFMEKLQAISPDPIE